MTRDQKVALRVRLLAVYTLSRTEQFVHTQIVYSADTLHAAVMIIILSRVTDDSFIRDDCPE